MGMTEREQVIAELLYLKHDCLEGSATDQTLDKALALLKAQEPVEPTLRGGIGGYWYCGACNYQISRGDKFCRYCGRAVKWE